MEKPNVYCGNCGKFGHMYKRCTAPITSLGIICFKQNENEIKYLMIQRRDTLGFVEFMRGKYNIENISYIFRLFKIMTISERKRIEKYSFDKLWNDLWMNKNTRQYHNEYENSKKKFYKLQKGIKSKDKYFNISDINNEVEYIYDEPEWGFPKGRRNLHESDFDCANREFQEETGLKSNQYELINYDTHDEVFLGSNNIRYKHVYYLAKYLLINDLNLTIDKNNFDQISEVSNIKWFSYEECLDKIRPYNIEKKDLLDKINNILIQ